MARRPTAERELLSVPEAMAVIRCRRGWSQGMLARQLGVSASTISRYESGVRKMTTETLEQVARALDVAALLFVSLKPGDPRIEALRRWATVAEERPAAPPVCTVCGHGERKEQL